MRSMIAALSALALLGACAPGETPVADEGVGPRAEAPSTQARAECRARGGEMQRVGLLGSWQCIVRYADAGKRCTDGDQCQGDCRAADTRPPPPRAGEPVPSRPAPQPVTEGVCQADSNQFGCYAVVEDGRAAPMICVD